MAATSKPTADLATLHRCRFASVGEDAELLSWVSGESYQRQLLLMTGWHQLNTEIGERR